MSGADEIFPAPDAGAESDEPTLTVAQAAERVGRLLAAGFPSRFWLVGETSEWEKTAAWAQRSSRGGHWYFRLVEPDPDGQPAASLNLRVWRPTVQKLFGPRGRLRRVLQPTDGLVLRFLVRVAFYAPRGEVGFVVEDVDPESTLGRLDAERQELLACLQAEGALLRNKTLPLPDVPLRVGLVTSEGSAAYHDVVHTLTASGLGFVVLSCDARTQGAQTCPSVRAALATLAALEPEVILLVRGGGSRLDLSWFDKEELVRAVCDCPVPVLTGVGHEIDLSLADAAAHRSFKTPTAAAEFLVARGVEARGVLELASRRLREVASGLLGDSQRSLSELGQRLPRAVEDTLRTAEHGLVRCREVLQQGARELLHDATRHLVGARGRLVQGRAVERMARLEAALAADGQRLRGAAAALLQREEGELTGRGERLRLLDPRQVLARGYAWLRRPDGAILKDAAAAQVGQSLVAVLRDGELDLETRAVRPRPAPSQPGSVPVQEQESP